MLPLALTLLLTGAPLSVAEAEPAPPEPEPWELEGEDPPRLDLTLWIGQAWLDRESGLRGETYGAEATWRFDAIDAGLFAGRYELLVASGADPETRAAPVLLVRFGQRFETRNGLLAAFTFGAGAAETDGWRSWFQVALGVRATFGPAFVAGELAFESEDVLRLALGLGVSLF